MKTHLMLAFLALTPALLAADPGSTPLAASSTNAAPVSPEELADQAALVQQIGTEAARGFDVEAHAHSIRVQIESLVSSPTAGKGVLPLAGPVLPAPLSKVVKTAPAAPPAAWLPSGPLPREAAMREAIQKLRAALDDLDRQLNQPPE